MVSKFYGLRQQAEKDSEEPYFCVSDFIAPKSSNMIDYIGAFACSAGHGLEEVVAGFKAAGDDYSYIMAEALADRLAEAFAEKLHELTRRELWGYSPDEQLSVDDMLKVKYQVSNKSRATLCERKRATDVTIACMLHVASCCCYYGLVLTLVCILYAMC